MELTVQISEGKTQIRAKVTGAFLSIFTQSRMPTMTDALDEIFRTKAKTNIYILKTREVSRASDTKSQ